RPTTPLRAVAALRTPLGDQSGLKLFGGREHTGEAATRRYRSRFKRAQSGFRITPADRLHNAKRTERMVNMGLPSAPSMSRQAWHSRDRARGARAFTPPVLERQR